MDNNPLRQYFRRPVVYLKLPSGGLGYEAGVIDMPELGELPVYPMTAIDEITTRTPDALFNGTALADLIKSCIPNIKDPWSINSSDLDSILIAIKAASGDETLDIASECPKCHEVNSYGANLLGMLSTLTPGDYATPITIGELTFKFRPLVYREMNAAALGQFELQRVFQQIEQAETDEEKNSISKIALEKLTILTMNLVGKCIEYIEIPASEISPMTRVSDVEYIIDFLKSCDRNTYTKLRDHQAKLKSDAEVKPLRLKCVECDNEYEQEFTLSPVDFFE